MPTSAIRDGRIVALGLVRGAATRTIDATGPRRGAGLHRHPQPLGRQHPRGWRRREHGAAGRHVDDLRRGRLGGALRSAGHASRAYFDELARRGITTNVGSYVGSSQVWTQVHGDRAGPLRRARARRDARAGPRGDGAGRARRRQLAERAARRLDRHRHAGRDVPGGGRVRRHLLDAHAHRGDRRVRGGRGGDRDRPPRAAAGGHHPPQDRRAHDVGADARAGRAHRQRARRAARRSRRTSIRTAPARTTSPASSRPGRTRAERRR